MAKTVNLTAVEKLSTYNEHTNLIVEQEGELNRVAIADLKISSSEIYKQDEEPIDAPEGALWIDTDEKSGSGGSAGVSSWNDLTDKPFGETTVKGDTLTWNGNTEGREKITMLNGKDYYRVSDAVLFEDDFVNGFSLGSTVIGEVVDYPYTEGNVMAIGGVIVLAEESVLAIPADNFDLIVEGKVLMTFAKKGIYFQDYVTSLTIPNYNGFETTTIKPIDPKYLPDNIGGGMPEVTAEDNGKFLRVVDGKWAAVSVPNAEEASF